MPDIDMGALTIPIFATIFSAGWGACYAIVVRPMTLELAALKTKVDAGDKEKDLRIRALEKKLGLSLD